MEKEDSKERFVDLLLELSAWKIACLLIFKEVFKSEMKIFSKGMMDI